MDNFKRDFFKAVFISLGINIPFLYIIIHYITISIIPKYFFETTFLLLIVASICLIIHYLLVKAFYFNVMAIPIERFEKRAAVEEAFTASLIFPFVSSLIGSLGYIACIIFMSVFFRFKQPGISYKRLFLCFLAVTLVAIVHFIYQYFKNKEISQQYCFLLQKRYDYFPEIQKNHYQQAEGAGLKKTLIFLIIFITIFISFISLLFYNLERDKNNKRFIAGLYIPEISNTINDWKEKGQLARSGRLPFDIIIADKTTYSVKRTTAFIDDTMAEKTISHLKRSRVRLNNYFFTEDSNDIHFYLHRETESDFIVARFDITNMDQVAYSFQGLNIMVFIYAVIIIIFLCIYTVNIYNDNISIIKDKIKAIASGQTADTGKVVAHSEFFQLDYFVSNLGQKVKDIYNNMNEVNVLISSINDIIKAKISNLTEHILSTKDTIKGIHNETTVISQKIDQHTVSANDLSSNSNDVYEKFNSFNPLIKQVSGDIGEIYNSIIDDISLYQNMHAEISKMNKIIANLFGISSDNSSGLLELDASIKQIKQIANEIRELAQSTFKSSESGEIIINNTRDAFYQINDHFSNISGLIGDLKEKTNNIDFIIEVIHDVAKKTNLLSLNASIIASQSGESGKSFLIVASEIHLLAEKTTVSIKNIEKMVSSIKENVNRITDALNLGQDTLGNGMDLITNAGDNLKTIVEKAKMTLDQIKIIYKSISEQSESSHMITHNSQTIFDDLKDINNRIDAIQGKFSGFFESKQNLKDKNMGFIRIIDKISSSMLTFENDLKDLKDNISKFNDSYIASSGTLKKQAGVFDGLKNIYERDDDILKEIDQLQSEITKVRDKLKES